MLLLSEETLQTYLSEICSCQALEVHAVNHNIYIPYMMNDALECYLLFPDAQLTGSPLPDYEGDSSCEITHKTVDGIHKTGIIFHQSLHNTKNVFTLWYTCAYQDLHCYRYDQIGHFWVSGQEHWRRLVYILGTIYDKYQYMGSQVCNPLEIELLKLMEFAPLYFYSPIHEPLDDSYPNTPEGLQAMKDLAKEAGDKRFLLLLALYRYLPFSGVRKILQWALNRPARTPLYELLFYKIQEASSQYPQRDYGKAHNRSIEAARVQLTRQLLDQGYQGEYPLFQKENLQILAMEEHPFTILEASDFPFRIQLMISETANADHRLNAGFFNRRGHRCQVTLPDESLFKTLFPPHKNLP